MEKLLDLAVEVATNAHAGQFDKGGQPYIMHPIKVAESVDTIEQKIIAYLHDVCEDSDMTPEDLLAAGFPENIVSSVKLLTKPRGMSYVEYIEAVKQDNNARCVKIADLKHNSDISRIKQPTKNDFKRIERYQKALVILEGED